MCLNYILYHPVHTAWNHLQLLHQFKILGRANFSGCSLPNGGGGGYSNPLKMERRGTPKIFETDLEGSLTQYEPEYVAGQECLWIKIVTIFINEIIFTNYMIENMLRDCSRDLTVIDKTFKFNSRLYFITTVESVVLNIRDHMFQVRDLLSIPMVKSM